MTVDAMKRVIAESPPSRRQGATTLRVAALLDTVQVSGPGRQLAALAKCLRYSSVDLLVVTFHRAGRPRAPFLDFLDSEGVRYVVHEESGPFDRTLVGRVRRQLAEWKPDVVQTHGYKPTVIGYLLRRDRASARWPWIAFFHGATSENLKVKLYHWLGNRMLRAADRVVVMSEAHRTHFSHLGDRVRVVHNAAIPLPPDGGASPSSVVPRHRGDDDTGPRIGVVGRLSPEKGVDLFLQACQLLQRRDISLSAFVVGDGPERHRLERMSDALGLTRCVHFTGATSAVQSLYEAVDLLVIPSRSEGLPNVLLEALRADLPVVATRVGAIPEVLDTPYAGVVVPPGSPALLADGIVRALPLKHEPKAREARRAVVERFSIQCRAQAHLRLYDAVRLARENARAAGHQPGALA